MTQQLDLIGICLDEASTHRLALPAAREVRRPRMAPLVDTPRAANADPESSRLAAASIKASGALNEQQQLTRDWVHRYPGRTSAELAVAYAASVGGTWQQYRPMFARRLGEIACDALNVKRGDMRKCEVVGRECVTWWPA